MEIIKNLEHASLLQVSLIVYVGEGYIETKARYSTASIMIAKKINTR